MRTITQTQISAYERCRRYYYLKYIKKLAWPVEESTRAEIQKGADFHLLAHQLIMGMDPSELLFPADDEKMRRWIDNFCRMVPLREYDQVLAEKEVSALHSGVLWLGMFDALAIRDDRITVYDWKTTGHPVNSSDYLRTPQTRLYRFLAKMCAPRLLGIGLHGLPAENIEMIYWFPEHPETGIRLPYSESAFREDLTWLELKAAELTSGQPDDYPRTSENRRCRFCKYQTHCFPENAHLSKLPEFPDAGDPGPAPEDVFQDEFLFDDPPDDSDRESVSF